jgi:hypothetical protein
VALVFVLGTALGVAGGKWLGERGAEAQASEAARTARAELAAAVCADAFMDQQAAHTELLRLVKIDGTLRADALLKEGWATMPDRSEPDAAVARLCAMKLGEAYSEVRANLPLSR